MIRIHIVGSCRSGTTLFHKMMLVGFEIDGHSSFEMKVFREPEGQLQTFCSKRPRDLLYIGRLIDLNPDLWVICLERDPRDVAVSHHNNAPDEYWIGLQSWKQSYAAAKPLVGHPRFRIVRYENMVRRPDEIQNEIAAWMPFLKRRGLFSEFYKEVQPEKRAEAALGSLRPVSDKSVGSWRREKARLAGELQLHGSVTADLIEMGYEKDDAWLRELEGVTPDVRPSVHEKPLSPWHRAVRWFRGHTRVWRYSWRYRRRRAAARTERA